MKLAKMKAFCTRDLKLGVFMPPMFFLHAGQALRQWSEVVNDRNTLPGRHPMDFELLQVGEFDDLTGVYTHSDPVTVASPGEYLQKPAGDPAQSAMSLAR